MSAVILNRRQWLLGMGAVPVCGWAGAGAPPKKDRVDIAMDRGAGFIRKCKRSAGPSTIQKPASRPAMDMP